MSDVKGAGRWKRNTSAGAIVTPAILGALVSERDWQQQVIQYAKLRGWKVHAERPARTQSGWRTAIQGDPGWPDLVLVRDNRLLFAELKTDDPRSKVSAAQREWLDALALGGSPDCCAEVWCYVWRPGDWDEVMEVLR